jgi:hypothetical protein
MDNAPFAGSKSNAMMSLGTCSIFAEIGGAPEGKRRLLSRKSRGTLFRVDAKLIPLRLCKSVI